MYKEHEIVMLPTKEATRLQLTKNYLNLAVEAFKPNGEFTICKHLYVLSDDKIIIGDWITVDNLIGKVVNCISNDLHEIDFGWSTTQTKSGSKKIIATTDTLIIKNMSDENAVRSVDFDIIVPQISLVFVKYFIERYNKNDVITKVNVPQKFKMRAVSIFNRERVYFPMVEPDNTINIKLVKETYTREEMFDIAARAHSHGYSLCLGTSDDMLEFPDWIKKIL